MSIKNLQEFVHELFGRLEVLEDGDKFWFPATQVARILGYTNPQKAVRDHCLKRGVNESFRGVRIGDNPDGTSIIQEVKMKFINESNLYRLIIRSKMSKKKSKY